MFLGRYKTYFTGKSRILLPKKFRKELGIDYGFYIVLGPEGEIWGLNERQWQKEAEKILELPLTDKQGRIQRRKFFSGAEECILDSQGRFILPQEFIRWANIQSEVMLIGAGDHFEIWNPEYWKKAVEDKNTS